MLSKFFVLSFRLRSAFILLLSVVAFQSCSDYNHKLDRAQMADILFDMHTAEVLSSIKDSNGFISLAPSKDSIKLIQAYQSIFEKYNISYDEFYQDYYHYVYYKTMELDSIYRILQNRVADLQTIKAPTPPNVVPESANSIDSSNGRLRPEQLNKASLSDTSK